MGFGDTANLFVMGIFGLILPSVVFFLIAVIYLIGLLLRWWLKMPDEYRDATLFLAIVATWGLFACGIWATPLDNNGKIAFDIFSAILFGGGSIVYFDYKGKIPIGQNKRAQIWFWFSIGVELLQAVSAFGINIVLWEVVEINGYEVVTYGNLACLLFGIMGVLVLVYVAYLIKNREKYIKRHMAKYRE